MVNGKSVYYGLLMKVICDQANCKGKIPDASRRVLNIQLKELEEHELVSKKIYAQVPPKVEYFLTDFGKTLIPVISALGNWGDENEERLRKVILARMGKE